MHTSLLLATEAIFDNDTWDTTHHTAVLLEGTPDAIEAHKTRCIEMQDICRNLSDEPFNRRHAAVHLHALLYSTEEMVAAKQYIHANIDSTEVRLLINAIEEGEVALATSFLQIFATS